MGSLIHWELGSAMLPVHRTAGPDWVRMEWLYLPHSVVCFISVSMYKLLCQLSITEGNRHFFATLSHTCDEYLMFVVNPQSVLI